MDWFLHDRELRHERVNAWSPKQVLRNKSADKIDYSKKMESCEIET